MSLSAVKGVFVLIGVSGLNICKMITVILLYARLSLVSQPKPLLFCVSLYYRRLALFGETKIPKKVILPNG